MIRVGILGASGYTALELCTLLLRHPHVKITALTTRQADSSSLDNVHPRLSGRVACRLENLTAGEVAARTDCVFSCLPHGASATVVRQLLDASRRVVDFSADYRLDDVQIYNQWYQTEHPDPGRMREAVYGLPELFRDDIQDAALVANPGCYPTAAILAVAPFLKAGLISSQGIIIDAKSGITGAGRTTKPHLHFPECNENLSPYNVGCHRHKPEIDQILSRWTNTTTDVVFTPHLIPMDRGELITAYADIDEHVTADQLMDELRRAYGEEPFVRVVDRLPGTKDVSHTNFCDVTARVVGRKAVVIGAIDNLHKGASGAAVQNFNLMYGFPETTALL